MKVKDHYYSQKHFDLVEIEEGILHTKNLPKNLKEYYQSDKYISHTNKKSSAFEKIYSYIQKLNFQYKYKIIRKYFSTGRLLDYGAGNAEFIKYMQKKNYDCYGYEPLFYGEKNKNIYTKLEDIEGTFDIITLWHVLEHIENPEEILQFLRSKLNPNGILIIAIPNYNSFDAKYYKEDWAAWDVPRHVKHYSKNGAIKFFTQKNKFYLDKIFPLPFDSFYISYISAHYKKSKLAKALSPMIAVISNLSAIKSNDWSSLIYVLKTHK